MKTKKVHKGPDIFATDKQRWLKEGREKAKQLLKTRLSITVEDLLEVHPLPRYLHHNVIGNLLQGQGDFVAIGYAVARKTSSNGRIIRRWALKNPTEPPRRLHVRGEYDDNSAD